MSLTGKNLSESSQPKVWPSQLLVAEVLEAGLMPDVQPTIDLPRLTSSPADFLGALDFVFLADKDQGDRCWNHYYRHAHQQAVQKVRE